MQFNSIHLAFPLSLTFAPMLPNFQMWVVAGLPLACPTAPAPTPLYSKGTAAGLNCRGCITLALLSSHRPLHEMGRHVCTDADTFRNGAL